MKAYDAWIYESFMPATAMAMRIGRYAQGCLAMGGKCFPLNQTRLVPYASECASSERMPRTVWETAVLYAHGPGSPCCSFSLCLLQTHCHCPATCILDRGIPITASLTFRLLGCACLFRLDMGPFGQRWAGHATALRSYLFILSREAPHTATHHNVSHPGKDHST